MALDNGLFGELPRNQIPLSTRDDLASNHIGEIFPIRIKDIDHVERYISLEHRDQWVERLVGEPESQTLEFKEVLKGSDPNDPKRMTREAIRTINSFLNSDGGRLIIGVSDNPRDAVGLEADQGLRGRGGKATIEKKIDIAIGILEDKLKTLRPLGWVDDVSDLVTLVTWEPLTCHGKTVLVITCQRGPDAGVSVTVKGKQEFWVRKGSRKKKIANYDDGKREDKAEDQERKQGNEKIRGYLKDRMQRAKINGSS